MKYCGMKKERYLKGAFSYSTFMTYSKIKRQLPKCLQYLCHNFFLIPERQASTLGNSQQPYLIPYILANANPSIDIEAIYI